MSDHIEQASQIFREAWLASGIRGEIGGRVDAGIRALDSAGLLAGPVVGNVSEFPTRSESDVIEGVTEMLCELAELGYYRGKEIAEALAAAGLLTPSGTFASTEPSDAERPYCPVHGDLLAGVRSERCRTAGEGHEMDADAAERIGAILREHQPTSGMQVASGVTCRCGYWTGEERPGVTRPVGYSGLVWHQAQMIATLPAIGSGTVNGLDVRDWQKIAASKDEAVEAAVGALNRVRELHQPVDIEPSDTVCGVCSFRLPNGRYFGKVEEWPCATIQALDATPPVAATGEVSR